MCCPAQLGALSLVVLAVALRATILSVALPTLAPELGANASEPQRFVSAYTLVLAAVGIWAAANFLALPLGPIVGG